MTLWNSMEYSKSVRLPNYKQQ